MGWVNRFQAESMRALFDMSMIGFFPASKLPYVPALVLGAANDQLISPQEVVETACRLGVVAEVLPDTAHLMMLDTRWERARRTSGRLAAAGVCCNSGRQRINQTYWLAGRRTRSCRHSTSGWPAATFRLRASTNSASDKRFR